MVSSNTINNQELWKIKHQSVKNNIGLHLHRCLKFYNISEVTSVVVEYVVLVNIIDF